MTMDDLRNYRICERKPLIDASPVRGGRRRRRAVAASFCYKPKSDREARRSTDRSQPDYTHRLIESLKRIRTCPRYGDPDFVLLIPLPLSTEGLHKLFRL